MRWLRYDATSIAMLSLIALCASAVADIHPTGDPQDWPMWRGPLQNNTSPATNLPAEWDPKGGEGSNLLWKSTELSGRSTPIVMNGKLYTLVRHLPATKLECEKVVCVDAATGEKLWEHKFNVYNSDVPDTRLGWSSVVGDPETGRVYAQGVCGYFCCLDGETGKVEWERALHEEFGLLSTYGGRTNFPLIYDDTVLVSAVVIGWGDTPQWDMMGKPAHRFMAFDKATGELRWIKGTSISPHDTTYSTPTLATLNGVDALVFGSGDGSVWALQAGTGLPIWSYPLSRQGINVSPLVTPEGRVFMGHSEENTVGNTMGAMVSLDGNAAQDSASKEVWKKFQIMGGKSSPIMVENNIYMIDDRAKLYVFDATTGEQLAKKPLGTVQRSTPLYADGKVYVATNDGRWYTLKPNGKDIEVLHRMRFNQEASDGSPIVAQGRVYVPMSEALYCFGTEESIAAAKAADHKFPPVAESKPASTEPAHLQVVPYEILLSPGESHNFRVRIYNAKGEYLRDAEPGEVEFSVVGPGTVSPDGEYSAPTSAAHECALVTCKMGDLVGSGGRARIVPPLPWKFDFEGVDNVPLSWVQGRIRYVVREDEDGKNHYIAKPTELPTRPGAPTTKLGTRSQMWMGSPEMSDYTIQADVQLKVGQPGVEGAKEDEPEYPAELSGGASATLPTIGVVNSGYTFALFGPNQEARLYSWCSHDRRLQLAESMKIDADKWYTLKLKVVPEGDHAHVMGKVWERGTEEPAEWSLEFTDESPVLHGAPGLFGDSKVAEAYVDNMEVTEN